MPPIRERSGRIDLPIELTIGDVSAVTGMAAAMPDGRELQLSLLKLFLTQPVLIDAQGGEAPGQIVGEDGQPLPYGIQLVDLAAPPSRSWRISVANGSYTRFRFGVGIPQGCNSAATTNLYPLNPDSEMYWSWGAQFMFVRIEGAARSAPQSELESFFYHVGFEGGFARVTVDGTLNVNGISSGPTLVLDVARMLAAEAGSTPAPQQHAVPDGWVADNLERTGTFSFR